MSSRRAYGVYRYPKSARNTDLYIFGAGETARIAGRCFGYDSPYRLKGYLIDEIYLERSPQEIDGISVKPFLNVKLLSNAHVFVAFPASRLSQDRHDKVNSLLALGIEFASYISSRAFVDTDTNIGKNVLILEHNTIQSQVSIGDGSILWSGNHVGHQSIMGKFNFVTSHVCIGGRSSIGNQNYFGMNSTISDGVRIGHDSVIGANSFVNKDLTCSGTYLGTPAKIIVGKDPRLSI